MSKLAAARRAAGGRRPLADAEVDVDLAEDVEEDAGALREARRGCGSGRSSTRARRGRASRCRSRRRSSGRGGPARSRGMLAASFGTLKRGRRCTLVAIFAPSTVSAGAPVRSPASIQCWSWFSGPPPYVIGAVQQAHLEADRRVAGLLVVVAVAAPALVGVRDGVAVSAGVGRGDVGIGILVVPADRPPCRRAIARRASVRLPAPSVSQMNAMPSQNDVASARPGDGSGAGSRPRSRRRRPGTRTSSRSPCRPGSRASRSARWCCLPATARPGRAAGTRSGT